MISPSDRSSVVNRAGACRLPGSMTAVPQVPVPHTATESGDGRAAKLWTPRRVMAIPTGFGRFGHAAEEKLHHVAVAIAAIGRGAMPEVVMDDRHCAGGAAE